MTDNKDVEVGRNIRSLREARRLSLREVATHSGLSINAISRIERGESSPTVASLHQIAGALGVTITEFFTSGSEETVIYVKQADRVRTEESMTSIESLGTGLRDQKLEPFLVTVLPGNRNTNPITHAGQEFVYCLAGRVEYQIKDTIYELRSGYSLLFEASQPHCFWNPTKIPAQLIFVFQATNGYQHHKPI